MWYVEGNVEAIRRERSSVVFGWTMPRWRSQDAQKWRTKSVWGRRLPCDFQVKVQSVFKKNLPRNLTTSNTGSLIVQSVTRFTDNHKHRRSKFC